MDAYNVNPEDLTYPSPPDSSFEPQTKKRKSADSQTEQAKKKRKAWGQPVPEIVPILPPRKRAKTVEEKEQRKNERILRNRRAADKSRQRQKAAVADLERRTVQIEQENTTLKAMLDHYRSKFGDLEGFSFPDLSSIHIKSEHVSEQAAPSPMSMNTDYSHTTIVSTPAIAPNSPVLVPDDKPLPPLTNNLFPTDSNGHDFGMDGMTINGFESSVPTGLTQYPAAILCTDLQCQPVASLATPRHFTHFIHFLAQLNLQWMIYGTFWTTTLTPLYQIYQILVGSLPASSTVPVISHILANHFPLIVGLIFPPSPTTSHRNVLRTKLLSRLLTCTPRMARLLLAATDRELRAVVEDDGFVDDAGLRAEWAKLMTLKWMVVRLEVEHGRYRLLTTEERSQYGNVEGIDYVGLNRSLAKWREQQLQSSDEAPRGMETKAQTSSTELKVY